MTEGIMAQVANEPFNLEQTIQKIVNRYEAKPTALDL